MVRNLLNYAEIDNSTQETVEGYSQIRSINTFYEISGNPNGEWLILIHGYSASTQCWKKQVCDFNKHYRVLNFDLVSHGNTNKLNCEKYNGAIIANYIRSLMDNLGIEKAHICGISLGTIILQYFSEMFPERIHSIILTSPISTPNYLSKFFNSFVGRLLINRFSSNICLKFYTHLMLPGKVQKTSKKFFFQCAPQMDPIEFKKWLRIVTQGDHFSYLTNSTVPALIIVGDKDYCYYNDAVKLQDKYTNCEFKIINDVGHVLIFQKPEEYNQLVIEFINSLAISHNSESKKTTIAA
jgi:pimeloyl-ACP methyl ester carboxylesterase